MATPNTGEVAMAAKTSGGDSHSKSSFGPAAVRQFTKDVVREMKNVSWPSRTEVINTTIICVIAIFFFAAYLFVADLIFSYVIKGIEWGASKILG